MSNIFRELEQMILTNPAHGGKVDCHTCGKWMTEYDKYVGNVTILEGWAYFHTEPCFNRYEHYYGVDKPID